MEQEPTTTPQSEPAAAPAKSGSFGTVISIVLILAVFVIGALYVWGQRIAQDTNAPTATSTSY